ncbi:daunorubicin/doxorubicin resistance ABC transporter permease protein DrrB [Methanobrevibacter cuticularis]|uniref:Daunorubicin/doxorubicin resistance ABC transporter permease protein DrrB n=1 Tax=Methanobrevibacter cuticularis TaxID=47311 RepID=A0A166CKN0_9EURY|nr:ABC transporter permease [Methanobrevibacter cuticularis]KZX15077.1 daunorubicin/doxorubicin resistance ABC transporter permease protein DrrB [Methanobrevibacter cuticularis]
MTSKNIIPPNERKLKNYIGLGTTIKNTLTLAHRSLLQMLHNPEIIIDITLMPIMFTLIFTFLFGSSVSGDIASYLPIVIPGILIMTYVTGSGSVGAQINEDMDKGIMNRFKSMPIARIAPLAGMLISELVKYAAIGIIVFSLGFLLGYRPEAGILAVGATILFMMFITWCLSWVFAWSGIIVKSASTATALSMVIMFPLIFLSNAFVPVETLPGWLQWFANVNPLSHVINAVRMLLTNGNIGLDFWFSLGGSLVILIIFIPLTLHVFKKKQ